MEIFLLKWLNKIQDTNDIVNTDTTVLESNVKKTKDVKLIKQITEGGSIDPTTQIKKSKIYRHQIIRF
jgi:hypothetical protein